MTDQDGLDAFASTRPDSRDDAPPELVWLQDTSDGLEAFAPKGARNAPLQPSMPPPGSSWPPEPPSGGPDASGERRWMLRAAISALVCLVLAAAADGLLDLDMLPAGRSDTRVAATAATERAPVRVRRQSTRDTAAVPPATGGTAAASPATRMATPERVVAPARVPAPTRATPPRTEPPAVVPASRERLAAPPPAVAPTRAPAPRPEPPGTTEPPAAPDAVDATPAPVAIASAAPPPAPAPPLAPAPAPPVIPVAPRERETRAVASVLGQYRAAFNTLDATAALAVWPSVNEKTLARAFDRLADQTVSFDACDIDVTAGLAQAACRGTARYVPKVGSRTPKAEAREWRFSLRKADRGWLIDRVDAR